MAVGEQHDRNAFHDLPLTLLFASTRTLEHPVLGVPAAARALREVRRAGWSQCRLTSPENVPPSNTVLREIARLAPGLDVRFDALGQTEGLTICGEALISEPDLAALACATLGGTIGPQAFGLPLTEAEADRLLARRARELLAGTAKPEDGMVSRLVNRPFSQAVTRAVLRRWNAIDPTFATAATALSAAMMTVCLMLIPGRVGLVWGTVLFQLTSMIDGIDGEIARATFRSTPRGASADSLVDAGANILFFIGLCSNLAASGDTASAGIALAALGGLALGTLLLGIEGRRRRGVVDFNTVKQLVEPRRSRIMQVLTWLTMRDFYAFAAMILILLDLTAPAVRAFAVFVMGWLMVVLTKLARPDGSAGVVRRTSSASRTVRPLPRSPGS